MDTTLVQVFNGENVISLLCLIRSYQKCSKVLYTLTINSFVQEVNEMRNGGQHLFPGEVQQWDHSEAEMLQVVGELMYVHNGSHQLWVIRVIQVANEESDFISG